NIYSFLGMAPKEDPEILMHVSVTQPKLKDGESGTAPTSFIFKNVMENGLRYLNIEPDKEEIIESIDSYKFPKVEGKSTKEGTKVFPSKKVIVLTDKPTMPNLKGWSEREVLTFGNLTGIEVEIKGNGYVKTQSIEKGTKIKENMNLVIDLSEKVKSKMKD